jgi:cytochrome c
VSRVRTSFFYGTIAVLVSLLLARVHPFGDAGLYAAQSATTPILEGSQVPPEVHAMLVEKCADCHSSQTRAPFYGRFAPASWLMERDIVEARKVMNLSQWNSYSAEQQRTLAAKMAHEIRAGKMPPIQYRMVHWNARISDDDAQKSANWAHSVSGAGQSDAQQSASGGDPIRGKALFEKRCVGCHALTENHEGPRLQGVYGRTTGTAVGYAYSPALKKAKILWNENSLDKWLNDPDAFIPGNAMDFSVSKPQERQDLISYLRQSAGK